jgi:8-oxo-dGTP pyrophosphatase MutT (NUDIX family)
MKIQKIPTVSVVTINKDGKILLLKRSGNKKYHPNKWNIVAGKLKKSENPELAITREFEEETARKCKILMGPILWYIYLPKYNKLCVDQTFLATTSANKLKLNSEHTDYKWLDFEELRKLDTVDFLPENLHQIGIAKSKKPYKVLYKNWEGKITWRRIVPKRYYYGSTKWHTKNGWLLECFDYDKMEGRTYSVSDIIQLIPPAI